MIKQIDPLILNQRVSIYKLLIRVAILNCVPMLFVGAHTVRPYG